MELVSSIVDPIEEQALVPIKRHLDYLICYKRNIHNMEKKFNDELDPIRKDVQLQVEDAYRKRLEKVTNEVQTWLDNVMKVEEEVKRIKDTNNKGLLHFRLHHRLGKQAAAQIQAIDDLLVKKGNFNGVYTHSRPPPSTTGSLLVNYEGFVMLDSRKSYINEILDAFKDENVHMIGVYGMGGIGKTTLVMEAANKAMKEYGLFTEVVMVTVSQNLDVKKIQTGIAESLGLRLDEQTVQVRAGKIEERLGKKGNKVLVVLDDLWEMLELSKVRIPYLNNKGSTCKVVMTTRQEDVCRQMGCQKKVVLGTLSDEESWSLFNSRAEINVVDESPTMKEVARDVAKQCAGLPLALVVLGTSLKGKNLDFLERVLSKLKMSTLALDLLGVSNKLRESIELSCSVLESDAAKLCFLHCCLYPEDYDIDLESEVDDLMHMLVGGELLDNVESLHDAQGSVRMRMDQLKASCLLLEGRRKSYVRMHDVVRDVGILIGERDHGFFVRAGQGLKEWPRNCNARNLRNCRRLSLMSNEIKHLPPDPIMCTKLETLIMRRNWTLSTIPEKFFQYMGALKVLDLSYTNISLMPESFSCLTSLRVLNLEGCSNLLDISFINGLEMLEMLNLKDTTGVSTVPEDSGGFPNLRLVDLGKYNTPLVITYFSKVLRRCSTLEQLFIPKYEGCLAELASLSFLTHLHIRGDVVDSNYSLSQEPGSSRIWKTKLQEFRICFRPSPCECYSLVETEKGSSSLHLTRTKHFSPLLKALLEMKIDSLALVHCQQSEVIFSKCDIPPHVSHNLTQLLVSDCPNLTSLGDEPLFPNLKFMTVINCPKLARLLPSKLWQGMHQLEKLEVSYCEAMLHLFPYDYKPMAMTELLPKLAYLKLSKLPQLESVLQPFQCLPNLMELGINDCGLRCGLAYHEMEMAVADPFPKLQKLEIYGCKEMSQMISSSSPDAPLQAGMCIVFQNLCHLTVRYCPRLTHLFWSKQAKHMQQLKSLEISNCDSLRAVVISNENQEEEGASASTSTSSTSTSSTSITACAVVDHHHGSQYSFFPQLKELYLSYLPQLESVLQPFQCLPNLMELEIYECGLRCGLLIAYHEMEMAAADPFPKLEKLVIRKCMEMSQMISSSSSPDAPLQPGMCIVFQNLRLLYVSTCPRLTHLFWSKQAKHMQQLNELDIWDCESLRAVVISNENQEEGASTSSSTSISTTACMVVDHHHGSHSFFPQLKVLLLSELLNMVAFHQPSTTLPMELPYLKKYRIEKCPKLETPLLGPQTSERISQLDV